MYVCIEGELKSRQSPVWLAGMLCVLAGCTLSADHRARGASAVAPAQSQAAAGGCASTQVSATTAPPAWARAGFSMWSGIPWALGKPPNAVTYLFATQLVAGGDRPDHRSNKVLWVTQEPPEGLRIQGHPLGRSEPAIVISGQITNGNQLPSIVDVPIPGCWSFEVSWGGAPEAPEHDQLGRVAGRDIAGSINALRVAQAPAGFG